MLVDFTFSADAAADCPARKGSVVNMAFLYLSLASEEWKIVPKQYMSAMVVGK